MNHEDCIIDAAFTILKSRLNEACFSVANQKLAQTYLLHKLILEEREVFGALWLDVKMRLIHCEDIALGTLARVCIYPREVVKSALKHNAASVILYHNHPTGDAYPTDNDKIITAEIKDLLDIIDVKLLDHIIVAGTKVVSLANRGEL